MEAVFPIMHSDADVVFHALRYYAADLFDAFIEDDESPLLADAVAADTLAARLQEWLVANHQSLVRDTSA